MSIIDTRIVLNSLQNSDSLGLQLKTRKIKKTHPRHRVRLLNSFQNSDFSSRMGGHVLGKSQTVEEVGHKI